MRHHALGRGEAQLAVANLAGEDAQIDAFGMRYDDEVVTIASLIPEKQVLGVCRVDSGPVALGLVHGDNGRMLVSLERMSRVSSTRRPSCSGGVIGPSGPAALTGVRVPRKRRSPRAVSDYVSKPSSLGACTGLTPAPVNHHHSRVVHQGLHRFSREHAFLGPRTPGPVDRIQTDGANVLC